MTGRVPPLQAALGRVKTLVAAAAGHPAKGSPAKAKAPVQAEASSADHLAETFGLTPFERDVVLLAALPALEPDAGDLIGQAQGDPRLRLPSVGLALSVLKDGHWSAFSAEGPLRASGLLALTDEPLASARALILPERVLHHLVGLASLDVALLAVLSPAPAETTLAPSHRRVADDLARRLAEAQSGVILELLGEDRGAGAAIAAAAVEKTGGRACLIDPDILPSNAIDRLVLARQWALEGKLAGARPVIDLHDAASPAEQRAAIRFAAAIDGPVILLSPTPASCPHRPIERIDLPKPPPAEQVESWKEALGPLAKQLDGPVLRTAAHFTASPEVIAAVAAEVRREAETSKAKAKALDSRLAETLWTETRARTRPRLDELAQRIETTAGWDDIVLPERQMEMLKTLASQVRQRVTVYEEWGFGARGRRGIGINALFTGPSGTGKTLAAEVIGSALGLDVYRIDLSAVVSKWIGETEKNLRRVFDAAEDTSAVLLFDEADAMFGKRSEVKESHDRYANIEVSYLLQRMETYRGLAILTSNMRSHIDQAFLRRLRFLVEFPFPADTERQEIWRRAFPKDAPVNGLDFARLAQLNVPGGSIRNIALNAAFAAADGEARIGMGHVRAAARAEYEKIRKPLTDAELRGWPQAFARGGADG
jgi:Pyruvate/2-oxoacid:ferredoxin oxidoreductase gamma subunit